ncbi:hypothetical protein V1477_002972 [Vespula maculifrons]|uniref:Uncharacterized protein n=1 Tax=Vespula maculifrons TaxID=7453 RepID=A0ABD2CUU3_VESMC
MTRSTPISRFRSNNFIPTLVEKRNRNFGIRPLGKFQVMGLEALRRKDRICLRSLRTLHRVR